MENPAITFPRRSVSSIVIRRHPGTLPVPRDGGWDVRNAPVPGLKRDASSTAAHRVTAALLVLVLTIAVLRRSNPVVPTLPEPSPLMAHQPGELAKSITAEATEQVATDPNPTPPRTPTSSPPTLTAKLEPVARPSQIVEQGTSGRLEMSADFFWWRLPGRGARAETRGGCADALLPRLVIPHVRGGQCCRVEHLQALRDRNGIGAVA
jgi:hypothetical protein